jgi:radical SAM superfamily enzyme YgiQ (UPF0313 family)
MNPTPVAAARQIYFIQPKFPISYWGLEHFLPLTPYQAVFPPLGLLTLAGLTPPDFAVTLCDENIGESIDYQTNASIICITGYIIQIERVFEIAERFRALGKTVVIGGPLANLLPDVCALYCDVLFEGEAEYTWARFLRDYLADTVEPLPGARENSSARFAAPPAGSAEGKLRPRHCAMHSRLSVQL